MELLPMLAGGLLGLARAFLFVLAALLMLTAFTQTIRVWPIKPGERGSWIFWTLFRGGTGLTLLGAVLSFDWAAPVLWWQWLGLPLLLSGFGLTLYGYFNLGLGNTYCADDGLVTRGLYRYSRNPQYVASIVGFCGLAIFVARQDVALNAGVASLVYVLLPLCEEPWLERRYGPAYADYRTRVRRFV